MTKWIVSVARTRAELLTLSAEWTGLAESGGANSLFSTLEWQQSWYDAMGDEVKPCVAIARDGSGTLRALLPMALRPRGAGLRRTMVLELAGESIASGDHLGVVAAPGDRDAAWCALAPAIEQCAAAVDVVRFASMDEDGERATAIRHVEKHGWRHTVQVTDVAPRLALSGNEAAFDASLRTRFRKRMNYYARSFEVAYPAAEFLRQGDAVPLRTAMDALYALHAARWPQGGVLDEPVMRRFIEAFSQLADTRGWLRLHHITIDGRVIAALFAVHWHGTASYFQSGWDPAFAKWNVAELLVLRAIREAAREGCHTFDFLRGGELYKMRFPVTSPVLCTDEWARTLHGRRVAAVEDLLCAALRSARIWRTRAKRLLAGTRTSITKRES